MPLGLMTKHRYMGVAEMPDGRFAAFIYKAGADQIVGFYDTADVAAMVRDSIVFAMYGEFARLNFPELFDVPLSELVTDSEGC